MNLASQRNIKNLLEQSGIRPSKRLGQNFLVDKRALDKIVAAVDLVSQDTVLEIGPGLGTLTQELAQKAKKVVAVEKDSKMCEILKETLKSFNNIEIINDDIRISDFPNIDNRKSDIKKYKVVGNLPFYLAAPVIRKFLENTLVQPVYLVLMVQKEMGQRICAKPPRMNLLAVSVQFYAEPKILFYVPKTSFWPQPKVDAAIIKIVPNPQLTRTFLVNERGLFFKIMKAGFSQPRKQLINNLSKGLKIDKEKTANWLLKNNIQPSQRAETLSVSDWLNLIQTHSS